MIWNLSDCEPDTHLPMDTQQKQERRKKQRWNTHFAKDERLGVDTRWINCEKRSVKRDEDHETWSEICEKECVATAIIAINSNGSSISVWWHRMCELVEWIIILHNLHAKLLSFLTISRARAQKVKPNEWMSEWEREGESRNVQQPKNKNPKNAAKRWKMVYALANVVRQSNENRKEIGCERLKNFDRLFACNFWTLCSRVLVSAWTRSVRAAFRFFILCRGGGGGGGKRTIFASAAYCRRGDNNQHVFFIAAARNAIFYLLHSCLPFLRPIYVCCFLFFGFVCCYVLRFWSLSRIFLRR